jgi:hypothetical protein
VNPTVALQSAIDLRFELMENQFNRRVNLSVES